jgi:3-hydroxyisobutyrate dehydrogenase-like beta-hydroxyacid dehydrogenase
METIAVLGLGSMGQGIAICLIRRGYRVPVPRSSDMRAGWQREIMRIILPLH